MNYDFRIYTVHTPYNGPPTPSTVYEWMAFSVDPIPVLVSHTIDYRTKLQSVKLAPPEPSYGRTREEAIDGLKKQLIERIAGLKAKGISIEQTDLSITEKEIAEAPPPPSLASRG